MKTAPAPGDTDWNQHAGTYLSETSEVFPWADMASDWNMVSNQQNFIDQSIEQWWDLLRVSKPKGNCLNICYDVFVYDM